MDKKLVRIITFILVVVLMPVCKVSAVIDQSEAPDIQEGFNVYRSVAKYAYANPIYVSGAATNIKVGNRFYNLIETDYYRLHKDELLKNVWEEYNLYYEQWKTAEQLDNWRLYNSTGTFIGFKDDYTNPDKTVYLTVMFKKISQTYDILNNNELTLVYTTPECPCIVIRFTGSATLLQQIIDHPAVCFIAPALAEKLCPSENIRVPDTIYRNDRPYTSADARLILRSAVHLDAVKYRDNSNNSIPCQEKDLFIVWDLDFDGHITAADARLALRIAVRLDPFVEILACQ